MSCVGAGVVAEAASCYSLLLLLLQRQLTS
jgi:hypothetical protein